MLKAVLFVLLSAFILIPVSAQDTPVSTLEFRANGEDFVRQGFVSKDGWSIQFDHVFVALSRIRAYQTNPPYDPFSGELTRSAVMVGLPGQVVIDLAEGGETAALLLIGTVEDAPMGYYNAISFEMSPALEGDHAGNTLVIDGTAAREGQSVDFVIRVDESSSYDCGAYIGDERKGILQEGAPGEVELTFHFDHLFGDAGTPLEDSLNTLAPGFDMFAALAVDGVLDVTLSDLEAGLSAENYQMVTEILPTLGHTGEGHCHE